MGELAAARPLYERVLEGDKEQLGPTHPHTLDSIYNLARLYQAEGYLEKAIPLFYQELSGCEAQYGMDHQETKTSANYLYNLLQKHGNAADAEILKAKYNGQDG